MRKLIIILIIFLLPILAWGASYLYCETITALYGESVLADIADRISYPNSELETFKLLSYRAGKSTKIYYVIATTEPDNIYRDGCTVILEWQDGHWEFTNRGISGWSNSGSADDPVWPYMLLPG